VSRSVKKILEISFFANTMDQLINSYWIYGFGFFGQGLFGARLVAQLYLSEKAGRVVSPTVFWIFSIAASFFFLIYGLLRGDLVIIIGQFISFYIYLRNLHLKKYWHTLTKSLKTVLLFTPMLVIACWWKYSNGQTVLCSNLAFSHPIMVIGAVGQLALNFRFVYQWWYSEKHGTSILPVGFWHISTWASVLVLVYAAFHPIHQFEPVLLVSQGFGIAVYIRNVILSQRRNVANDVI
jgi:lipid-A-disaccharide synthase-like uncharacterized protein